ncbi:hypothetical protein Kpol_1044p4 [Vanderwaltozyma polyspora DSM 70294]|uniref:Uncharacterized protein n=1 Tax=Vanderwaltozyma polyspora (strain ATCC 22028 / DSM 70294 / BCRC 21397 / CBS 2163 / NBRC 10782 / NRRL Y-8283 / UCD 57-17) TaxID=436907 RepID=A7TP36_VANPO|nr:uncharacterized protein Kpol_1044p4 [Vanderwaltozyma polyspora DSM 70294]EDO15946.1 hypothetical protein Kpol_1044p4 [Vanderwaltozyma polyspora DSM 70294]
MLNSQLDNMMVVGVENSSVLSSPEVLDEDEFLDESEVKVDDTTRKYQQCLNTFVGGDPIKCIELMNKYGFLDQNLMEDSDIPILELFFNVCENIPNFKSIKSEDFVIVESILNKYLEDNDSSLNNDLTLYVKFLKSYIKFLKSDSIKDNEVRSIDLGYKVKNVIAKINVESSEDVHMEICEMIEIYFVHIEIKLQENSLTTSRYELFCKSNPVIHQLLNTKTKNGQTYYNMIMNQLTPKDQKVSKKSKPTVSSQQHQHQHQHQHNHNHNQHQHKRSNSNNKTMGDKKDKNAEQSSNNQSLTNQISRTLRRLSIFYNRLEISHRSLIVIILLIVTLSRRLRFLGKAKDLILNIKGKLAPSLMQLLNILASV